MSQAPPPQPPAAPPPGPGYGAQPSQPSNGMGTAALVLGILGFFCLYYIAPILAIIFGKLGMDKADRGEADNGGVAKAGFILGIVALVVNILATIFWFNVDWYN